MSKIARFLNYLEAIKICIASKMIKIQYKHFSPEKIFNLIHYNRIKTFLGIMLKYKKVFIRKHTLNVLLKLKRSSCLNQVLTRKRIYFILNS